MPSAAEIEAAFRAMRAIRTRNGEVHDDVLRAYARAVLQAVERMQLEEFRKRAELLRKQAEHLAADALQVAAGSPVPT
jgi:hypothetical protein